MREKLLAYADSICNPLGPKAKYQFIEKEVSAKGEKLGTYGVIKGAKLYLAAMEMNLIGRFEKVDLGNMILPHNTSYITSWITE